MEKNFDQWNHRKKIVELGRYTRDIFFHEREIWWCAVGANIGAETDGKNRYFERPVLIIRKFNQDMFWGLPLTSKEKTGLFYEKIIYETGCSWAMLTQIRTWSSKRLFRKVGMVEEVNFKKIQATLCSFITTNYDENKRNPS